MNSAILTIDDFPSKNTPAIVDYLNEKKIKAIFFAIGRNIERYYEEAAYAVKNGMIVGNHSYSHPAFSSLPMAACIQEIESCERVLDKLYQDIGAKRTVRPFRFPYGDKGGENKAALQRYFRENGFHKVDDTQITYPWWQENGLDTDIDTFWTFDFMEYKIRPDSGFTRESVWERMHDANPELGAALFPRAMSQAPCLHEHKTNRAGLANAARVNTNVSKRHISLGAHQGSCAAAYGGVIDSGENNRHILLMHAHDETEEMLPEYYKVFIEHLLENGLTFEEPRFV